MPKFLSPPRLGSPKTGAADDSAASLAYVQSRGSGDLVTNGSGTLGNNYNFSMFDFTALDAPTGAAGSFLTKPPTSTPVLDEFLPVDPRKKLQLSLWARQTGTSDIAYNYAFASPYDAYKNSIAPSHYMFTLGTLTTLAVDLNPGATTVTLTSSTNWYGSAGKPAGVNTHFRTFLWWDFVDAGGKLWPPETYSRNFSGYDQYADGALVGNVITLRAPYAGVARPAGTAVSNGSSGGSYLYGALSNTNVPKTWTAYSASIVGLATPGVNAGFNIGWPAGVGYAKLGFLPNRVIAGTQDPASLLAVAAVSLSDAMAANTAAAAAIPLSQKGAINGVSSLDPNGKVMVSQLPAGTASGLATLDVSAKVPIAQLPVGSAANTVASGDDPRFAAIGGSVPAGTGALWFTNTPPAGWLLCDGTVYAMSTYPALGAVLLGVYGGDGSTTFAVPNHKGRAPVMRDAAQTEFDTLGETGGAKTHTLATNEMPVHTHIQDNHTHDGFNLGSWSAAGNRFTGTNAAASGQVGGSTGATAINQNAGSGAAHNNLQPYFIDNFIIKT